MNRKKYFLFLCLRERAFFFFSEHGPPLEQALPSRLHHCSPPQLGGGHGGAVGRRAEDAAAAEDQGKVHSHTGEEKIYPAFFFKKSHQAIQD